MPNRKLKFIILCLIAALFIGGMAKKPTRFQSAWMEIGPGETLVVAHPLGVQPAFISVLVKQVFMGAETAAQDIETIRPHTELADHPLYIQDMSPNTIEIVNFSQESYIIQVNLQ